MVWKYQNVPFTRAISGASVQALLGPSPVTRAGVGKVYRNDEESLRKWDIDARTIPCRIHGELERRKRNRITHVYDMWSAFASEQRRHGQDVGSSRGSYGHLCTHAMPSFVVSLSIVHILILSNSAGIICQHIVYVYKSTRIHKRCTHAMTSHRHLPLTISYHHQIIPNK